MHQGHQHFGDKRHPCQANGDQEHHKEQEQAKFWPKGGGGREPGYVDLWDAAVQRLPWP